jgi:hypothetical protein
MVFEKHAQYISAFSALAVRPSRVPNAVRGGVVRDIASGARRSPWRPGRGVPHRFPATGRRTDLGHSTVRGKSEPRTFGGYNISGGTDLCGAFCTGNRELPQVPGEMQCRQLGSAVEANPQCVDWYIDLARARE